MGSFGSFLYINEFFGDESLFGCPLCTTPLTPYTRGVAREKQSEKRPYAPPIATPRIRLHVSLHTVGGGTLLRGKEGSVMSRLGRPARTPLFFGRGRGWGGVRKRGHHGAIGKKTLMSDETTETAVW